MYVTNAWNEEKTRYFAGFFTLRFGFGGGA
jgi:hypothetical protein